MGYYKDGKYVYTPSDENGGMCDSGTIAKQEREKQKKLDWNNAGEITSPITPTKKSD